MSRSRRTIRGEFRLPSRALRRANPSLPRPPPRALRYGTAEGAADHSGSFARRPARDGAPDAEEGVAFVVVRGHAFGLLAAYPSLSVGRPALIQSCLPPGYSFTFVYPMVTSSRATLSEACQLKLVQ